MSVTKFRGAVEWALMVALVFGAGAIAQAQNDASQDEAKVIQIGPADPDHNVGQVPLEDGAAQQPELPKHWIGLLGGPVTPEVRHHVEVPENQGVMIREVMPDSPAAKAGIERFDILLRANDTDLHEMIDLVDIVRTQGEQKGQITLEVLRHGERETVYVTPEDRPAHVAAQSGNLRNFSGGLGGLEGMPGQLGQLFGQGGAEGGHFRNFGPGVIVGGQGMGLAGMPSGVSISVQKNEGEPTKITIQRGDESWEVSGDDAESLQKLPEDLRPFVERMLHEGGPANFNFEMPQFGGMPGRPGFDAEQLQQRIEAMERRMQEMQERFLHPNQDSNSENHSETK